MPPSSEAQKLRQELKEWERAFADTHNGRKPTRDEIKQDAKIASKYTEYYKLTGPSTKPKPSTGSLRKPSSTARSPPLQNDPDPDNPFAPSSASRPSRPSSSTSKRPSSSTTTDIFKTPSKPYTTDLYDSPLSTRGRRLFGNRPRDTVGPTPQKTGKILGIFESFIDVETTPTHQRVLGSTPATGNRRVSASPFTTPRKRKAGELEETPSKAQKDVFATPSFLRRDNARAGAFVESPPVPRPIRPLVRGLSSMVAELRKMEDDAHGDDEEAMREMEAEMEGGGEQKKVKVVENNPDTGLPPAPEGAWAEEQVEEELPSGEEEEGAKRPKWKKKGLKRQHRRVIMRPVGKTAHVSDAEEPPNPEEAELPAAGYEDEDLSDLDAEPEAEDPKATKRAKTDTGMVEKGKEVVKKVARKISEKAHANYRRLNIRGSKGAKAGKGGGRFSRKKR